MKKLQWLLLLVILFNHVLLFAQPIPLNEIFPNPFQHQIQMITESLIQRIEVYDFKGQLQLNLSDINTSQTNISMADIAPGLYMILSEDQHESIRAKDD